MSWELTKLKEAVADKHGESVASILSDSSQAFASRSAMAHYHASETKRLLEETTNLSSDEHAELSMDNLRELTMGMMSGQLPREQEFFEAEAHLIASAQAIHSLCDIVCHVLYWAFRLDQLGSPPILNRLNLHKVNRCIESEPSYRKTTDLINNLTQLSEFKYLRAFVNTVKHQSLVDTRPSISFGEMRFGLQIKKFSYIGHDEREEIFDKKWSSEFIEKDNTVVFHELLKIGMSINQSYSL